MKTTLKFICAMVLVGIVSCASAWAQTKAPDAKAEELPKLDPGQIAEFSKEVSMLNQMVSFAEANKDSLIMISAVRVLDSLPFEGVAKPGSDAKSKARYDRNEMLNQAKEYASGDKEVLAMVARLKEVPERTDVRHPGHHGHHHGHHHGWHHGGFHGGYHGGGYWHPTVYPCVWVLEVGPLGWGWVCR